MKRVSMLLALGLGSCAGLSPSRSDRSGRMVKTEDLPARQREALEAWRRGGAAWEVERERIAADAELSRFLIDNLVVEMVRAFDRAAIATDARPSGAFDRAQAELVRLAERSTSILAELLAAPDGIVAYLAADTLERIGAAAVSPAAAKLTASDPEVRRRAAELLGSLPPHPSDEAAILEGLGKLVERDEAWIVRAQAARALGERGARHVHKGYAAAALARACEDPDSDVRKSAFEGLAALGEASSIPTLIRRLERSAREGDLAGLRAAQAALRRLTGETRDLDPKDWWALWSSRGASPAPGPR